jgi:hypothetical protein
MAGPGFPGPASGGLTLTVSLSSVGLASQEGRNIQQLFLQPGIFKAIANGTSHEFGPSFPDR